MSYYGDDVFADGDYDLGDDDYRDYLARANSGREDDYDKYDDRQERLEQANFRRDVLNGRYDRILGIIFGDDEDYEDFEFDYNVEQICDFHNTEIPIVSNEENDKSLLEGLAEDVIAIIHLFQSKLREIKHKIVKGSK